MTKRQFVVLVFRLFALYLLLNLISNLAYILRSSEMPGGGIANFLIGGFAIFIALAFISLLWKKSEWLMLKVFAIPALSEEPLAEGMENFQTMPTEATERVEAPYQEENSELMDYYETPLSIESIELVAFSVVGLWVAINALPSLTRSIEMMMRGGIFSTQEP
ncbi:MAG: hypothetical protein ACHQNE_01900 [Candidatus Kapaibacterium sp.]